MNQRLALSRKIIFFLIFLSASIIFSFAIIKAEANRDSQYEIQKEIINESISPQTDFASVFTFTPISETECDVRLADKTATKAIIPEKVEIDGKEYEVTVIAVNGFTSASKLELVRLPKSVKTIGQNAFANCKALTSLTLPAVETIGANAFSMTKMEYLIIPTCVTSVASTILRGTNTQVYVRTALEEGTTVPEGWVSNWNGSNKNQNVEFNSDYIPEIKYEYVSSEIATFVLGDDVTLRDGGYYVTGYQEFCTIDTDTYKEVYIPATYTGEDGVEYPIIGIDSYAFYFNDIDKVTVGYSETPIQLATESFYGLNGSLITFNREIELVSNDFDDNEVISESVFACSTVNTIILPSTLTEIGNNMFDGCEELRDIHFIEPDGTLSQAGEENINIKLISTQKVNLPSTIIYIGASAFALTKNILELNIPNSVQHVGSNIINGWKSNQIVNVDYVADDPVFEDWNEYWALGSGTEDTAKIVYKSSDNEYTITYNIANKFHNNPENYVSSQGLELKPVIKPGYIFEGWYLEEDYKTLIDTIEIGTVGNLNLFAKLIANTYMIQYDKNRPSDASNYVIGDMSNSSHSYDISSVLNANAYTLKGWTFKGWNTKADGSGESYIDLDTIINLAEEGIVTLYAQWEPISYNIEYIGSRPNNASSVLTGSMSSETHNYEEEFNIKKNAYSLEGWSFKNWNTEADGSGVSFSDEALVKNISETKVTLYAQWTANEYSVVYNSNKPSATNFEIKGSMDNSIHVYDVTSFLRTNSYTLEGYNFAGWNTKADSSGTAYSNGAEIKTLVPSGLIELYAQWQAVGYEINYMPNRPSNASNNVAGETASSSHFIDTTSSLTSNGFTLTGWSFKNWNTKMDGSGISFENKASVTNLITNTGTTYLYAQWQANEYNVIYKSNRPSATNFEIKGSMDNSIHVYDVNSFLRVNTYTLEGYNFIGWNTKMDGSGTSYSNSAEIKTLVPSGAIELYAQWQAKTFVIEYKQNQPSNASNNVTGETANSSHTVDITKSLTPNGYELLGWTFIGWNTKEDGSGSTYQNNSAIINLTTSDEITYLYAQWQTKNFVIEYKQNQPSVASNNVTGETANSSHTVDITKSLTPNGFELLGWKFTGWNTEADGSGTSYPNNYNLKIATESESILLYAQWQAKTFVIEYKQNQPSNASNNVIGETANSSHTVDITKSLTPNGFELLGWRFIGWNTKADGSGRAFENNNESKIATNETIFYLYAQWIPNEYTINYVFNKPNNASKPIKDEMGPSHLVVDKQTALADNAFVIEGWTFTGWNTKADGSGIDYENKANCNFTYSHSGEVDLYAQWRANSYTVIYNKGQGTGTMNSTTHYYDTSSNLGQCTFTYLGSSFKNWNTEADGSGTSYSKEASVKNLTSTDRDSVYLYAQWEKNDYKVVYIPNKPENASHNVLGQMDNSDHKVDSPKELSENLFTLNGWTFTGWNTKADGSGTSYTDQELVNNLSYQANAEVTLYAQWRAHRYFIKYDANLPSVNTGLTNSISETTEHVYDTPSPINGFYTLISWKMKCWSYNGRELSANAAVKDLTPIDGITITLKAVWVEKDIHECLNSNGAYEIVTVNQLKNISTKYNYTYKLLCDLDVGEWKALPTFYGELYLNEHKITYRNESLDIAESFGFVLRNYGKITSGKFYPTIKQFSINSGQTTTFAIGGVAAYNSGTIANIYVMSTVGADKDTASNIETNVDINARSNGCVLGGVAGYNYGEISNCRNEASIAGSHYIGGIAGSNEANAKIYVSSNNGRIWYCSFAYDNKCIGGIVGANWSNSTIMHCNNFAEVRFAYRNLYSTTTVVYMGSLVGWCHRSGNVEYCHGIGKVVVDSYYEGYVVTLGDFGKISYSPNS